MMEGPSCIQVAMELVILGEQSIFCLGHSGKLLLDFKDLYFSTNDIVACVISIQLSIPRSSV